MGLAPPRRLALVLAALLPFLVLGAGWRALRDPPTTHGHEDTFARKLRGVRPRVVVLGSSLANRGIDAEILAHELGVPAAQVVVLQLPHASAAHWYAILKNEIVARGIEPEIVVVAGALTTMLNHELLRWPANVERLGELLTDDEPVLAAKVFGLADADAFRRRFWRASALRWREALLRGFRDLVLAAGLPGRARLAEASRLAAKADERVFANEAMDYTLHREGPAGQAEPSRLAAIHADAWSLREHALLPDLDELADSVGARLVFVRMPFPPSNPDVDAVPPAIEAEAVAWIEELGATWVDLRTLDLSDDDFEDMRHLSRRGAAVFSAALGRTIAAGRGGAPDAPAFGAPEVVGEAAELPLRRLGPCAVEVVLPRGTSLQPTRLPPGAGAPLRVRVEGSDARQGPAEACDGTWRIDEAGTVHVATAGEVRAAWSTGPADAEGLGWWVAPGAAVRWTAPAGTVSPDRLAALARATALGAGGVELRLVGAVAALAGDVGPRAGVVRAGASDGPIAVEVAVLPGAAPVLLHHLAVGLPPETVALVGRPETLYGASVRVLGGRADDTGVTVRYAAPPAFPARPVAPRDAPRRLGHLSLPTFSDLADAPVRDSARPSQCSPLRVLEDGTPLARPHALCFDAMTRGEGRSCHAAGDLWFAASDDSDPVRNRRSYAIDLDPSRACATLVQPNDVTLRGSRWLYPGDEATFVTPAERLAAFRDGADTVVVEVLPLVAPADVPLQLTVRAEGREVASTTWTPPGARRPAEHRWILPERLSPRLRDLEVVVRNPSSTTFHLVTLLAVEEASTLARSAGVGTTDAPDRREPATLTRVGAVPTLPPLTNVGRGADGVWTGTLPALAPVAQPALERLGLGAWSPLRLRVDGEDLLPIASKRALQTGCEGCVLHLGATVSWRSPRRGAPDVHLDPAFPIAARQGPVAWIYPGQTVTVPLGGPGDHVMVRALAFHAEPGRVGEGAWLGVAGREVPFETDGRAGGVTASAPVDGASVVTVRNGSAAGLLLLDTVDRVGPDGVTRLWWLPGDAVP